MEKTNKSDFRFDSYKISHASIDINGMLSEAEALGIEINPRGVKRKDNFILTLETDIKDKSGNLSINIVMDGFFSFREDLPLAELSGYFAINAPAIMFPYLRGYISMLTSLSGDGSVVLPVLNLVDLGKELLENIEESQS